MNLQRGKLIGLVGYAGSGKTTLTRAAITHSNPPLNTTHHRNFSRPIVNMLAAMGIPRDVLDNKERWNEPLDLLCGHTVRYAATTLGTEWGRDHIGVDLWTRIALADAEKLLSSGFNVVIDNVRFPSEMDAMIAAGALDFIAMERPGLSVDFAHISERKIAKLQHYCTTRFVNEGSFPDASQKFAELLKSLLT